MLLLFCQLLLPLESLYGCSENVFHVVAAEGVKDLKVTCEVIPPKALTAGTPFNLKCSGDDAGKVHALEIPVVGKINIKSRNPIETDEITIPEDGSHKLNLLDKDNKVLGSFEFYVYEKPVTTTWWEDMIGFLRDTLNLRGEMKMGVPLATARRSRLAALEDKMPSTVNVELKSDYLLNPGAPLAVTVGTWALGYGLSGLGKCDDHP